MRMRKTRSLHLGMERKRNNSPSPSAYFRQAPAASHPDKIPSSIPLWTNFSNSSM